MKKILVIDGNLILRNELIALLRQSNYQVITASTGKEGLRMALTHLPDLILYNNLKQENQAYAVLHLMQPGNSVKQPPFMITTTSAGILEGGGSDIGTSLIPPANASGMVHSIEYLLKWHDDTRERLASKKGAEPRHETALQNFVEGRLVRKYKKNQTLFDEGHHPKNIFYIQKGKVKIFKINEDGRELVMRLYGENEFLGYVPVLEDTRYKGSAKAIENTEVAIIPRSDFDAFIHSHPWALNMFIRQLATEVGDYQQLLLGMAYNPLRKKVAETLLRLISKIQPFHPQQHYLQVSRPTLAALAGTATESLTRALSEFKKENLIDIRDGKIFILDPRKLTRMRH